MAAPIDVAVFKDGMIVLGVAAVLVPLARRLGVTPVVTYLAAGAILGPFGLAALAQYVPALTWVSISRSDGLGIVGELGVVALLFLIGIELSFQRLMTMRRLVFGLGGLQILVAAAIIGGLLYLVGAEAPVAVTIGFSLALSSTAIVIETLSRQGRLATSTGRSTFSVLLMQDLAVVPLIFLVTIMSDDGRGSVAAAVLLAFGQAILAIALISVVAGYLLRPLFRLVADTESPELFVAATLLVIVGSGMATAAAGMSMALGAFVAGIILAETEYRRAIMATVEPFKGLLLGVFFFSVGMSLDLLVVVSNPVWVIGGTIVLIASKLLTAYPLLRWYGIQRTAAIETTFLLAPGGEFAFITIGLGVVGGLLHKDLASVMLAVTTLSMLLIPVMDVVGRRIAQHLEPPAEALPVTLISPDPDEQQPRMIIVGFGRVGDLASDLLEKHDLPYLVVDRDPAVVSHGHHNGKPVYFGDARDANFLRQCGIQKADAVLITINQPSEVERVIQSVRSLRPDIRLVARARDAEHARKLYELGATDAVPETIEASLQLSEAALVGLGVPTGLVIASIHEKRDEFRAILQGVGGYAGQAGEGSARSKLNSPESDKKTEPDQPAPEKPASPPTV
ncbi:MAG: CPA2 family monovalent cation:H+ antiporter-2 [Hyphomicrobiaceae bacterium]|jgi:CPA2 family monovalent cation:H+ antiporter-2